MNRRPPNDDTTIRYAVTLSLFFRMDDIDEWQSKDE